MDADVMTRARAGLEAWQQGDLSALEPLLDAEVELLWWEPGEWDCHGREAVMACLRERVAHRGGTGEVELVQSGEDRLVVSRSQVVDDGPAAGLKPATVIRFRGGKVVSMRQCASRDEALAAWR